MHSAQHKNHDPVIKDGFAKILLLFDVKERPTFDGKGRTICWGLDLISKLNYRELEREVKAKGFNISMFGNASFGYIETKKITVSKAVYVPADKLSKMNGLDLLFAANGVLDNIWVDMGEAKNDPEKEPLFKSAYKFFPRDFIIGDDFDTVERNDILTAEQIERFSMKHGKYVFAAKGFAPLRSYDGQTCTVRAPRPIEDFDFFTFGGQRYEAVFEDGRVADVADYNLVTAPA